MYNKINQNNLMKLLFSLARILLFSILVIQPAKAQLYNDRQTQEIAAIMNTVACAAQKGMIPRSKMGSTMKEMFASKGFSSQRIYSNWDYYYRNAKFYGSQAGLNCLN